MFVTLNSSLICNSFLRYAIRALLCMTNILSLLTYLSISVWSVDMPYEAKLGRSKAYLGELLLSSTYLIDVPSRLLILTSSVHTFNLHQFIPLCACLVKNPGRPAFIPTPLVLKTPEYLNTEYLNQVCQSSEHCNK